LLCGLPGLLIGGVQLLVDLGDAFVDLVDAGLSLIDRLRSLGHCGAQLSNLLRPLLGAQLLGQLVARHRNRRN